MLAACVFFSLVLSSSVSAQLVFNKSDIDESFGLISVTDSIGLSYGLQPFPVTADLASAVGIEYNAAFSADPITLPADNNRAALDVRTWDLSLIHI